MSHVPAREGLGELDHLGVAVRDLKSARALWVEALGLRPLFEEEVPTENVRVLALAAGGARVELLESTSPDGPIARFIERRGPGLHHVCFKVADVADMLQRLKQAGIETLDESPRDGAGGCRVAFLHPKATGGVLVEISEGGPKAPRP